MLPAVLIFAMTALGQVNKIAAAANAPQARQSPPPAARVVELKASDGTLLKASYFYRGKAGPRCVDLRMNGIVPPASRGKSD